MSLAEQPQWVDAFARGNVIRLDGAKMRRLVASGEIHVTLALLDPRAGDMGIGRLLAAQRRWNEQRAERYLGTHFIHPHKRVRDLTDRQVAVLVEELS